MNTRLILALACAAVLAACSVADSAAPPVTDTLSWTMPTQYTDGSAIAAGDLVATEVVWGTAAGGPYPNTQDVTLPATSVVLTRPGSGYGLRCYKVAARLKASLGGTTGLYSAEACKAVQAPPNAPTGLTVQ